MHKLGFTLFLIIAPVAAAEAQSMPVSQFLAKADALKKKGPLALFSGDIKLLKAEVQNSARAYGADVRAARKAGRLTHSCPPAGGNTIVDEFERAARLFQFDPACPAQHERQGGLLQHDGEAIPLPRLISRARPASTAAGRTS